MKAFGIITKGKLILNNKRYFTEELKGFEGKEVVIKIEERSPNRSKEQNSLFWKWIGIISNETGYTKEETKELISYKFLARDEIDHNNNTKVFIKGTSTLTRKEFSTFMNEIMFWANDTLGINLPSNE